MSVVVDLGCKLWGSDSSIGPLVDRFSPDILYGFDPAATPASYVLTETPVVIEQSAAWTYNGTMKFSGNGDSATVMSTSSAWNGTERDVPCFDFSEWLEAFDGTEVVVKMDIEGSEVPILEKVIADGTDNRISLLIVEWHDGSFDRGFSRRRKAIESVLRCPVEIWP